MSPTAVTHPIRPVTDRIYPIKNRNIEQLEHGLFWLAGLFGARWFCSARGGRRILSINDRLSGFEYFQKRKYYKFTYISNLFQFAYSLPQLGERKTSGQTDICRTKDELSACLLFIEARR